MNQIPCDTERDEEILAELAMKFRSTRGESERQAISRDYSDAVDRLISSGRWKELPALEDQLPDAWMPKSFFEFWRRQLGPA